MPSIDHELPLTVIRESPEAAPRLLRALTGIALPRHHEVRVEDTDLSQAVAVELRADLVLTLRDARGAAVAGLVIESQRRRDRSKELTWPAYAMIERARIQCPVYLIVLAGSQAVARWAAAPIPIGPGGAFFQCAVIGARAIPRIRTAARARELPELAVLSAIAHGRERDGLAIALAAFDGVATLDEARCTLYNQVIWQALSRAAHLELEKTMLAGKYEIKFRNPLLRSLLAEKQAEGEAQGKAKGEAEGRAKALLVVLSARRLRVGKAARERILSCHDLETLDRWIARAATVGTTSELFAGDEAEG